MKTGRLVVYAALAFGLVMAGTMQYQAAAQDAALMVTDAADAPKAAVFQQASAPHLRSIDPPDFAFAPSAQTTALSGKHFTLQGAMPRVWYDFTPTSTGPMPLVILLHGAGRDGLSLIEMWRTTAQANGLALAAPNSFGQTWDIANPQPAFLAQIVDAMAASHAIDRDRVFLFGHSDGAAMAQILLTRTNGPWRAAAMHAGYAPFDPNMSGLAKPYRLYIGENEQIFSIPQARDIGKSRAAMGQPNDLIIVPDHDHWFYGIGPQIAADAWDWFASVPQ